MRDETRMCKCGQEHPWGVVRESDDHVPLYGPRDIPSCDNFRPEVGPDVPGYTQEVLIETSDLNPQASAATRVAVARLRKVGTDLPGRYQQMVAQWPHFVSLIVGEITDMRGALVREDSKLARFIAHTDEILNAMENVAQLSEQLKLQNLLSHEILERLEKMEQEREASGEKLAEVLRESAAAQRPDEPVDE